MKMKVIFATVTMIALAISANAAVMTASDTAPGVDSLDIANLGTQVATDKWWNDAATSGRPKGQTFTPGTDGLLNAITYRITDNQSAEITKEYVIRVSTVNRVDPGNSSTWVLTPIHTENATQTVQWIGATKAAAQGVDPAPFMTWTLDSPVPVSAGVEYGIDIGMTSTTSSWQTGIPYIVVTNDEYAGGTRYMSGTTGLGIGDTTMNNVSRDLYFHLNMVPEPATICLLGVGGLSLLRRRKRT